MLLFVVTFACARLSADGGKALVGGTLINGLGSTPIQNNVILVRNGRIEKVGTIDTLQVPEGYEVISTEAMSVLPGLWDMHVHLMINGHSDYDYWDVAYADKLASEIMPASAVQLLLAGVTTARDLGAPLEDSLKVRDRINAGVVLLVGTDNGIPMKFHCQSTWNELDVWVRIMDIPAMETIQSATYWPSKFMGVENDWGTIVAGRYADIIAVKGDVLKYINLLQDVDFVMKGGVVYKHDGQAVEENLKTR